MADYRAQFADAIKNQMSQKDPLQAQYEAEVMRSGGQGASIAPTLGLIDHLSGSNLAAQVPKKESMKDKLGQLLQLRQGNQAQNLNGLGKLASMQTTAEDKAAQRALQERMYGIQMMNARSKLAKANTPKLGSEDKKALGYTQSLQRDLQAYKESIKNGGIRPALWSSTFGDTPTSALRKALVENYGRLQSGGAISGDEESRFGSLFGDLMDDPKIIDQKLKRIEQEISDKSALYGGAAMGQQSRIPSANTGMDYDSMSDAELAALLQVRG